jgi:predicted kinase
MVARYDRPVQSRRPLLVIVSGAPGAGKSTLAAALARDLSLPLVARDELKETLGDVLGSPTDVAASSRLGAASYALVFVVARRLLGAGCGLVIESNFRRGSAERELRPLIAESDARLVHCTAGADVLTARYTARFAAGGRHAVHLDGVRVSALADDLAAGRFEPLELDVPTLIVDTGGPVSIRYDAVLDFVRTPLPAAAT